MGVCDITFDDPKYGVINSSLTDACQAYAILTVIEYLFLLGYLVYVLRIIFLNEERSNKFETKKIILYLLSIASIFRIIRYSITSDVNEMNDLKNDYSFKLLISLLFSFPLGIAYAAFSLLIYMWIYIYHKTIKSAKSGLKAKDSGMYGLWFKVFIVLVVLNTLGYLAATILDLSTATANYLQIYSAIAGTIMSISILIYGRRMANTIKGLMSVKPDQLEKMKILNRFCHIASALLLGTVVIMVISIIIDTIKPSIINMLVRQYLLRISEGLLIISISTTFKERRKLSTSERETEKRKTQSNSKSNHSSIMDEPLKSSNSRADFNSERSATDLKYSDPPPTVDLLSSDDVSPILEQKSTNESSPLRGRTKKEKNPSSANTAASTKPQRPQNSKLMKVHTAFSQSTQSNLLRKSKKDQDKK